MLDATGLLLADRTLLYRVNLAYKNNNTFQDLVMQHSIFSPLPDVATQ
ncbi:MAG: hypothetical protein MRJ92_02725 [Nitrospira sp.]|nr:hypothetical protein [Nitrospira sp.]